MSSWRRFALGGCALAACALLAGCALLAPKFQKPTLSIESIEIERSDFLTQHLQVHMRAENPNDRVLAVQGLSFTLYIEGAEAAHAVSDASFIVPALGAAQFDVQVTADMAGTLLRLLGRGVGAGEGIEYRVVGQVQLSRGLERSFSFDRRGTFSLR